MMNLLEKAKQIRENLSVARQEYRAIDRLLEQPVEDSSPDYLRYLAERMRATAAAKDGDWVTKTFTASTADELRCLADAYDGIANDPSNWEGKR